MRNLFDMKIKNRRNKGFLVSSSTILLRSDGNSFKSLSFNKKCIKVEEIKSIRVSIEIDISIRDGIAVQSSNNHIEIVWIDLPSRNDAG